jgi:hypothetical protein
MAGWAAGSNQKPSGDKITASQVYVQPYIKKKVFVHFFIFVKMLFVFYCNSVLYPSKVASNLEKEENHGI